jgi:stage II sporulation protein P
MGRNVRNGQSLLFIVITLIVVAVVGARFFGFMPESDEAPKPPIVETGEPEPPQGVAVDPTPKVLVFHSHTSENYKPQDSHARGTVGDVVRVGEALVAELASLGITAIHDKTIHDQPRYSDAFINSEKKVNELLAANSGIQMVLDIHRDGLQDKPDDYTKAQANGMDVAKILFVVGDKDNERLEDNIRFAQRISDALEREYPGVTRGVRVFKSDYSGELHPNSIMVLIGDWRGNTIDEAVASARLLARVLAPLVN